MVTFNLMISWVRSQLASQNICCSVLISCHVVHRQHDCMDEFQAQKDWMPSRSGGQME